MYVGSLPAASNRAQYVITIEVIDDETGEGIDLSDRSIVFSIRDHQTLGEELSATDADGIDLTNEADGIFTVTFTATQMRNLEAKTYDVGCTITPDDDDEAVDQYIIGTLAVLDGVVS